MICKYCGKEIDDRAVWCIHCGRTLNKKPKLPPKLIVLLSAVIIFIVVLLGTLAVVFGAKFEKISYEAIITTIENKNYEEAQNLIEEFIQDYPDSEYIAEINEKKNSVDAEVEKIKAEKKAKEEQERLNAEKPENAKKAGVSLDAFENMINACKVIDIEYGKISNITAKTDWANGKRCSFNFNGYTFLVYFNQDGTVNSINCGTVKFYENGKKVEDWKNRLITSEEEYQIKSWAEESVKAILKSPSTAKFPGSFLSPYEGWSFSKDGNNFTVSSYVDSQNGFGATMRSKFTITYEWTEGTGKVVSLIFDGKKVV